MTNQPIHQDERIELAADGDVFKALADPSRRQLLDSLFVADGQTQSQLAQGLVMTRFGVMKHLAVLQRAGLVTSRKAGREKLHFLNPVPLQEVYDRWVGKYARPWTRTLLDLKYHLEAGVPPMTTTATTTHVLETYIRTSPERLWQALVDPTDTARYYFGTSVTSSLAAGTPFQYLLPDGNVMVDGEVIEADPPRKLVTTFRAAWEASPVGDQISRVSFEITPLGTVCKLTLVHDELTDAALAAGTYSGWQQIFAALKTLLETGQPLELPDSM